MLDQHINKNGYLEISLPLIASMIQVWDWTIKKFENDQFEIKFEEGSKKISYTYCK